MAQAQYEVNNLLSFNINGLGKEVKRTSIFEKLKKLNCISFLQETFSQRINENKWKRNGKVKSYSTMEQVTVKAVPFYFQKKKILSCVKRELTVKVDC